MRTTEIRPTRSGHDRDRVRSGLSQPKNFFQVTTEHEDPPDDPSSDSGEAKKKSQYEYDLKLVEDRREAEGAEEADEGDESPPPPADP